MRTWTFDFRLTLLIAVAMVPSCEDKALEKKKEATPAAASAVAAASFTARAAELPPAGCKAGRDQPAELGVVVGDVHGFAHDGTHLYYSSWALYGGRGEVGTVRKDGKGLRALSSVTLEPRGLSLDTNDVYYTTGIRLSAIAKAGGDTRILAPQFSSQQIAVHADDVYGVPGDYGPYDRIAKIPAKGGEAKELLTSKRPARELGPNGFSSVAVDASGIYVTDSGGNRLVRYSLEGDKPKILASRVDKPYALAIVGPDVYFNLAQKGELMIVSKAGGAARKLASGLSIKAHIAADEKGVYTTLAGKDESQILVKVPAKGGELTPIAPVPAPQTVEAIALDGDCMYWAQRVDSSKTVMYALAR